jgi:ectoine hydroxylase-related dioxygenase (phytanoyl-CoA dioxygenase family)
VIELLLCFILRGLSLYKAIPSCSHSHTPLFSFSQRLVCFVYLQDTPSAEHGATAFVPHTANAAAHGVSLNPDNTARIAPLRAFFNGDSEGVPVPSPLELATLKAGDAIIYDASVLHFGCSNEVEGNERAVFYFGVSRKDAATQCAGPEVPWREVAEREHLADWVGERRVERDNEKQEDSEQREMQAAWLKEHQ